MCSCHPNGRGRQPTDRRKTIHHLRIMAQWDATQGEVMTCQYIQELIPPVLEGTQAWCFLHPTPSLWHASNRSKLPSGHGYTWIFSIGAITTKPTNEFGSKSVLRRTNMANGKGASVRRRATPRSFPCKMTMLMWSRLPSREGG